MKHGHRIRTRLLLILAFCAAAAVEPAATNVEESPQDGNQCNNTRLDCAGDVAGPDGSAGDGQANIIDLLTVIEHWDQSAPPNGPQPTGDCAPLPDGDCVVNALDVLLILEYWGPCSPLGACCMPSGACLSWVTESHCNDVGGAYFVASTNCASVSKCFFPVNDNCGGTIKLKAGMHSINNFGAFSSPQPPPPKCVNGGPGNFTRDVWYRHIAKSTGPIKVNLCVTTGNVSNTVLAVYGGDCPNNLTLVACDDDGCPGSSLLSAVTFNGVQSQVYYIRVGSWGPSPGNQGNMVLAIKPAVVAPPNSNLNW